MRNVVCCLLLLGVIAITLPSCGSSRKANATAAPVYDTALQAELEAIEASDQRVRRKLAFRYLTGRKLTGPKMMRLFFEMAATDSLNMLKVDSIIRQRGYPGRTLVGPDLMNTAWLVIQHADLKTQEKYLPMLDSAARRRELSRSCVALLEDRVRVGNGQKQRYGSQYTKDTATGKLRLYAVEDMEHLDSLRQSMGLPPMALYAKKMHAPWPPRDSSDIALPTPENSR